MKRSMSNLMSYAASPSNPPKGYPLETALKVAKYRSDRFDELGFPHKIDYETAAKQIAEEIREKFGDPK